jgi:tetratricopeptide (TPR) repeat protein
MDDDKVASRKKMERAVELYRWASNLRRKLPLDRVIEILDARRRGANDDDLYTLSLELRHFLSEAGREHEADRIIDEMIARLPDDVRFPLSKASLYLYWMDDPKGALAAVNVALARAQRTGFFRREALGDKARILLKLGLGDQLTQTLEEIMSLERRPGIPDIMRERDFVDGAPSGMISDDVLARYNAFCPKRDDEGKEP